MEIKGISKSLQNNKIKYTNKIPKKLNRKITRLHSTENWESTSLFVYLFSFSFFKN